MTRMEGREYWMTQRMARLLGLNLTDAGAVGPHVPALLDGLLARCGACIQHETCAAWMSKQVCTAREAPEFCVIAPDLQRLAGRE